MFVFTNLEPPYVCVHSFDPPCVCDHLFEPSYVCVHLFGAAVGLFPLI